MQLKIQNYTWTLPQSKTGRLNHYHDKLILIYVEVRMKMIREGRQYILVNLPSFISVELSFLLLLEPGTDSDSMRLNLIDVVATMAFRRLPVHNYYNNISTVASSCD